MTYRQWMWGVSNGVLVLAVSGFVWVSLGLGVGFHPAARRVGLASMFPALAVLNLTLFVVLLLASIRLRRKASGFTFSDLRHGDANTRRIVRRFRWVLLVETILIAMAGFLCFHFQRGDLAWSWIALVLGVHFLPLAWLFGVPSYYATGVAGSVVALLALVVLEEPPRTLFLGYGMGLIAWCSCAYLAWNADRLAPQSTTHP